MKAVEAYKNKVEELFRDWTIEGVGVWLWRFLRLKSNPIGLPVKQLENGCCASAPKNF